MNAGESGSRSNTLHALLKQQARTAYKGQKGRVFYMEFLTTRQREQFIKAGLLSGFPGTVARLDETPVTTATGEINAATGRLSGDFL